MGITGRKKINGVKNAFFLVRRMRTFFICIR